MKPLTVLGIESSCDETSAAVLRDCAVLTNVIATQKVHEQYGGVVPELASRAHLSNIVPTVDAALKEAGIALSDLDGVAYTAGPGLIGALMVGSSFAKGLSIGLDIPLIAVDHIRAHVLAHLIKDPAQGNPAFPFLCLTVSGGHTQIVRVDSPMQLTLLGQTIDDAAGEAFDKAAKILGLPYPGGPLVDKLAKTGNPDKFKFAKPATEGLAFSFSGLKTSVLYFVRDQVKVHPDFVQEEMPHLCASIQKTIVTILIEKLRLAVTATGIRRVALAGGVSANSALRAAVSGLQQEGCEVFLPKFEYCTDNAAMIAICGHYDLQAGNIGTLERAPQARFSTF